MHSVSRGATFGALCLTAIGTAFAEDGQYVKSFPVTGTPEVNVRADDAHVRVVTADVREVEFRVDYSGYTLGETLDLDSRTEGDVIVLTERIRRNAFNSGFPRGDARSVSIEVRMPKTGHLEVSTGDGDVRVESLTGPVSIRTGDGDVEVRQLNGEVSLTSGDGDIRIDDVKGKLSLRTGDGSIEGTKLDGELQAWSGDGEIDVDGRFDSLALRAGDGSVRARVATGSVMNSGWSIYSSDGDIELTLPKNFKADLHATTNEGRIDVEDPLKVDATQHGSKARGVMNGGGMTLVLRTSDGRIRIGTR